MFDPGLAQSIMGSESPRLPSATGGSTTIKNIPPIIGGTVGGVIGLGLVAALFAFLFLRSSSKNYELRFQRNPNEEFVSNTTGPSTTLPSGPSDGRD